MGYYDQLRRIAGDLPILYPGDICEWDASPEDINFLITHLPQGYAVPGNHDLPNHDHEQLHRSAYETLCLAGVLRSIPTGQGACLRGDAFVYGWGHGQVKEAIAKPVNRGPDFINIALIHGYVWAHGHQHPGAQILEHADYYAGKLRKAGYNVAVFGDNHNGFIRQYESGITIVNPGCLVRRRADEREYNPMVAIIHADGSVSPRLLDLNGDVFADIPEGVDPTAFDLDVDDFVADLQKLGDAAASFRDSVRRFAERHVADKLTIRLLIEYLRKPK